MSSRRTVRFVIVYEIFIYLLEPCSWRIEVRCIFPFECVDLLWKNGKRGAGHDVTICALYFDCFHLNPLPVVNIIQTGATFYESTEIKR